MRALTPLIALACALSAGCAAKPVHVATVQLYDGPKVVQAYDVALALEQEHQKRKRLVLADDARLDTASTPYLLSLSDAPEPNTAEISTSVMPRLVDGTDLIEWSYGVERGEVGRRGKVSAIQQGRGVAYLLPGDAAELRIPGTATAQMRVTYKGVEMRRLHQ
mgnify:CR=1 FL=1